MSKKMMKRSLALGALMAFVITGSAMAADFEKKASDETKNTIRNVSWDGNGFNIKLEGEEKFSSGSYAVGGQNQTTNLKGYNEIVFAKEYQSGFLANNAAASIILGEVDDEGNIVDRIGTIRQEEGSYVDIFFSPQNGVINAYVDNIYMNNVGNAIYAQNGSDFLIDATGDVEFGTTYDCTLIGSCCLSENFIDEQNTVTINANNLKLTATKGTALGVTSYKWTTGEPPYEDITGKNLLDVNVKNNLEVDARIAVEAKNGTLSGNAVIDIDADNEVKLNAVQKGINARDNATVNIDANQTTITTTNDSGDAFGTYSRNDADVTINGNVKIIATTTAEDTSKDPWAVGVYSFTDDGLTNGNQVNIGSAGKEVYIEANNAKWKSYGVMTYNNASVLNNSPSTTTLTGSKVTIKANTEDGHATGVMVGNDTVGSKKNLNTIVIDSPETIITASAKNDAGSSVGIQAISEGVVKINNGNVTITADRIISTRGTATTEINANNNDAYTVQLTGDIAFDYDGETSGTPVDANVNINLANAESFFTGKIGISGENIPDGYDEVNSMNIKVTNGAKWNLTGASIVNHAEFGKDSVLNIVTGSDFTGDVFALNASGAGTNSLIVEEGAKLQIGGMEETTYNLATGFGDYADVKGWNVIADNALMSVTLDKANGNLKATLSTSADAIEDSGAAPVGSGDMLQDLIKNGADNEDSKAAYEFVKEVTSNGGDLGASNNALSNALQMAEAGGNSGTAVTVANNVSSVTTGRMGFSGGEKGGHGVGLLAEDSGAAIWAQYVHGKDRVEDMPMSGGATSYEGQFNGVVMGVDFKKVGKFQSGVAFNYGEGDTNSFGNAISTRSDYDFWGVGYYGNIRNEDTNFIFDVNYAKSDSDVEQVNGGTTLEASPETTTWSAGVKVEKLYQNNNVQIVPYTGLRFMSVDTDSYKATNGTDTLFNYAPERQDIWLLPLGVSIKQEVTNANGWTVTPKVDLSYIWAFGDTDSEMTVAIPGVSSTSRLGYTVMDDESWLGVVGLEAAKGDWTFGVSYSYQKGDHSENEKWYVDAKYSF